MKSLNIWTSLCAVALAATLPTSAHGQTPDAPRFVAETPTPRVDYWQKRASDIGQELSTAQSLEPVRLVFVGDSITDFWHLDANPWFPGLYCGWSVWNESFGGAVPQHKALNLGVSGDRIEHVLHRLLPAAQGGEGWLDRPDLQPDTLFVMLGINNSFDAEKPATTSIIKGVEAVVARLRERRPKARIVIQSLLPTFENGILSLLSDGAIEIARPTQRADPDFGGSWGYARNPFTQPQAELQSIARRFRPCCRRPAAVVRRRCRSGSGRFRRHVATRRWMRRRGNCPRGSGVR